METENKVVDIPVAENNEAANAAPTEITVVENGGKVKKILKWVIGGVALAASFVGGMLLGKSGKDDDDDSDAESESPTED